MNNIGPYVMNTYKNIGTLELRLANDDWHSLGSPQSA